MSAPAKILVEGLNAHDVVRALIEALPPDSLAGVLAQSFTQLTFTNSPLPGSLLVEAQHAAATGLLKPLKNIAGIYDLGPLNQALRAAGQQPVSA